MTTNSPIARSPLRRLLPVLPLLRLLPALLLPVTLAAEDLSARIEEASKAADAASAAADAALEAADAAAGEGLAQAAVEQALRAAEAARAAADASARVLEAARAAGSDAAAVTEVAAVADAGAPPYQGHIRCEGNACKVDLWMIRGFRAFSQCQVCHGLEGTGSTIGPSLVDKLKEIDKARFVEVVTEGYKGQIGVMPGWKENPNVMNYIEQLYAYLKARSDGALPPGRPKRYDR